MQNAPFPSTVVVVQAICTNWGKPERGGANAVLRNGVPEALALPGYTIAPVRSSFVIHKAYYGSGNGFKEPTRSTLEVLSTEPTKTRGISLAFDGSRLNVFYQYNMSQGAPERFSQEIEALSLSLDQWGRILYNGRHSDSDGHWYYEKRVYNVGLFASPSLPNFTQTQPVKIFNRMAHLL